MVASPRTKFDRTNPVPPDYLCVLRNRGHWRQGWWHYQGNTKYSTVLNNTYNERLPKKKGVFLDAGCGHSPDAGCAVKFMHFKKAVKVDLWKPYMGCPSFDRKLRDFEGPSVRFIQGDICKLSDLVAPASVDFIGCNAVIDLMCAADRDLFYNEAEMVLAPGGTLIVYHIPLASGHQDWVHGSKEVGRFASSLTPLVATQSLLVFKKEQP